MSIAKTTVLSVGALLIALVSDPAWSRPLKITAYCTPYPAMVKLFQEKGMAQVLVAVSNDKSDLTEIWTDDRQDEWALVLHRHNKLVGNLACISDYGNGVAATRNFLEKGLAN